MTNSKTSARLSTPDTEAPSTHSSTWSLGWSSTLGRKNLRHSPVLERNRRSSTSMRRSCVARALPKFTLTRDSSGTVRPLSFATGLRCEVRVLAWGDADARLQRLDVLQAQTTRLSIFIYLAYAYFSDLVHYGLKTGKNFWLLFNTLGFDENMDEYLSGSSSTTIPKSFSAPRNPIKLPSSSSTRWTSTRCL